MSQHNYYNNSSNYGIPVAPPYSLDVEMTDFTSHPQPQPEPKPLSKRTSRKPYKARSPGKRVIHYQSLEPEHVWSILPQPKKGIGKQKKLCFFLSTFANKSILDFTTLLPAELCSYIISFLDFKSLMAIPKVSKVWARLFYIDDIWRLQTIARNWKLKNPEDDSDLTDEETSWYYWYKQRYQLESRWNMGQVATHYLVGHLDSVYCLQFDDQKIITGSRDRSIKIWDLEKYQCTHTLNGHQGSVLCLKYNDEVIISGSSDHTVIVWDMKTKRMRGRLHVSFT